MSAKKSWDVQRKVAVTRTRTSSAPARAVDVRKASTRPVKRSPRTPVRTSERSSSLKERRRAKRRGFFILLGVLTIIALAVALYVLWMPTFRVAQVEADAPGLEGVEDIALDSLRGTRFLVLPKNSIFFLPQDDIREAVLAAYPSVQAVSITATGLDSLRIKTHVRTTSFTWCGESVEQPAPVCYEADAEGLIFARAPGGEAEGIVTLAEVGSTTVATTSKKALPVDNGSLLVYGPLEGGDESLIRARVTYASALPGALKFVKAMRTLNADIVSVTLRGDEIDLHTKGDTRITYVIGREGDAATLAATSFPSLNVNDGSIEYIDLRFQNKVYLKRRAGSVTE